MRKSYLYAVRMLIPNYEHCPVKVGFSTFPEKRALMYFGSGPFPCEWLGEWPAKNGTDDERAAHAQFHDFRLKGEWFFPSPAILNFIELNVKAYVELLEQRKKNYEQEIKSARTRKAWWLEIAQSEAWEMFKMEFNGQQFRASLCSSCSEQAKKDRIAAGEIDSEAAVARINDFLAPGDRLLVREEEAAELLGVPVERLKQWRLEGLVDVFWVSKRVFRYHPRNLLNLVARGL